MFSPSYASYPEAIKVAGGQPVFVNLIERGNWQIDFKNLARKINHRTAAIIICNPNNPTGTIFPKEDLLKIAELVWKRKIFIICDEVYKDFIYADERGSETNLEADQRGSAFFSLAQIPQLRKIVIRVFSLSKAYAMTGWRIGFLHSDEENVSEIVKVHDSLVTCAPVISQYAAMAALDFADKEIEEFRQKYQERRDLICQHLDDLPELFSYQKPQGSYFVFPKIIQYKEVRPHKINRQFREVEPPKIKSTSWNFAIDLLNKAQVAVVPGLAFGPSGEGHIRMSFGRSEKDINEAMKRIKNYFTNDYYL